MTTLTTLTVKQANKIRFGVEIECFLPLEYQSVITPGRYHRGNSISIAPRGWNAQRDGSLRCPDGYFPCEIVSPILSGENGVNQVWYMVETLENMKAVVSDSCGVHVHVERSPISHKIGKLVTAFKHFEAVFCSLNGEKASSRLKSAYCQPSATWGQHGLNRNQTLNLRNDKTVEFRLFTGSVSPEFLLTAVYMAVALVSHIVNDSVSYPMVVNSNRNLNSLLKQFVKNVMKQDNRIIKDEPIQDMVHFMKGQINMASQVFNPFDKTALRIA